LPDARTSERFEHKGDLGLGRVPIELEHEELALGFEEALLHFVGVAEGGVADVGREELLEAGDLFALALDRRRLVELCTNRPSRYQG
jgi:hypothetical protein